MEIGAVRRISVQRQRAAIRDKMLVNVDHNVTGALSGCRFRDREVGDSNPLARPVFLRDWATAMVALVFVPFSQVLRGINSFVETLNANT